MKVPEDAPAKAVAPAKAARVAPAEPAARAEPAQAPRKDATQKKHPKAQSRQDLRGAVTTRDGKEYVWCKGCKRDWSYANWASHCTKYHPEKVPDKHAGEDDDDDDRDDDDDLLEQRPAEISDTGVPLEQKRRQRQDKPHPKVAAAKHDGGTRNTKKATCKSKPK